MEVLIEEWTEYERGWGQRPDGFSIHLTRKDYDEFIADYWSRQPKGHVPDEYSRESGNPISVVVESEDIIKALETAGLKEKRSIWSTQDVGLTKLLYSALNKKTRRII